MSDAFRSMFPTLWLISQLLCDNRSYLDCGAKKFFLLFSLSKWVCFYTLEKWCTHGFVPPMLIKPTDIAVSLQCLYRLRAKCSDILPDLLSQSIYIFPSVSRFPHHRFLSTSAFLSSLPRYMHVLSSVEVSSFDTAMSVGIKSFIRGVLGFYKVIIKDKG